MNKQSFTCPNCGAPLDAPDSDETTIRCPFCETSVIVPEELRRPPKMQFIELNNQVDFTPRMVEFNRQPKSNKSGLWIMLAVMCVFGLGLVILVLPKLVGQTTDNALYQASGLKPTSTVKPIKTATPIQTPTPTELPAFASPVLSFGEKGIGAGMLSDARYITIDGQGSIYIADYKGGRILAFDSKGKFLHQWMVGNNKTIINGMAANHQGDVFVAVDTTIFRYKGETGELLNKLSSPNKGSFGDLATTPDDGLAATWYEGRWGLITSLEGHRDDLLIFNPQGKITLTIPSFISGQTESLALDNTITVDGMGNIYALSDELVYLFSDKGKYLNHFGSSGNQAGQFNNPRCIAVDGQGQLYISDSMVIHVFSNKGQFVDDFKTNVEVDAMAFDEKGALWVLANDRVTQFVKQTK